MERAGSLAKVSQPDTLAIVDPKVRAKITKVYLIETNGAIGNLEDCISYVAESRLSNPRRPLRYVIIDYVRSETKSRGRNPEKESLYFAEAFEDRASIQDYDSPILIRELASMLATQRERTAFLLYYRFKFTMDEIGEVLGVGDARISQILKRAVKKLKRAVSR